MFAVAHRTATPVDRPAIASGIVGDDLIIIRALNVIIPNHDADTQRNRVYVMHEPAVKIDDDVMRRRTNLCGYGGSQRLNFVVRPIRIVEPRAPIRYAGRLASLP